MHFKHTEKDAELQEVFKQYMMDLHTEEKILVRIHLNNRRCTFTFADGSLLQVTAIQLGRTVDIGPTRTDYL